MLQKRLNYQQLARYGRVGKGQSRLKLCRIMCIGSFDPQNATSSNPHALSWSQLRAKENPQEPIEHVVIGGLALVMLFLGMAFV